MGLTRGMAQGICGMAARNHGTSGRICGSLPRFHGLWTGNCGTASGFRGAIAASRRPIGITGGPARFADGILGPIYGLARPGCGTAARHRGASEIALSSLALMVNAIFHARTKNARFNRTLPVGRLSFFLSFDAACFVSVPCHSTGWSKANPPPIRGKSSPQTEAPRGPECGIFRRGTISGR